MVFFIPALLPINKTSGFFWKSVIYLNLYLIEIKNKNLFLQSLKKVYRQLLRATVVKSKLLNGN